MKKYLPNDALVFTAQRKLKFSCCCVLSSADRCLVSLSDADLALVLGKPFIMWYGDNFGRFALLTSCIQGILRDTIFSTKDVKALLVKVEPLKMPCMQDVRRANLPKLSPYHMMNGSPRTRARSASDRLTRHPSALYWT